MPEYVPHLSVIIKCFNEEANIRRCLQALTNEVVSQYHAAEIILADSISTDRSVEIAREFDVTIVQLTHVGDRGCSSAGHLGWQFVRGRFVLLIDGDMVLLPGFLPKALAAMECEPRLGGVGGGLIEMSKAMEYRERQLRQDPSRRPGLVDHVTGCCLYRTEAVREAGYFMDRNLHATEEFELGLRLTSKQWTLRMLDVPCVRHYGHSSASLTLLIRRWHAGSMHSYGELLRAAWGTSYFHQALWYCWRLIAVFLWWSALAALAALAVWHGTAGLPAIVSILVTAVALPLTVLLARKRSINRAVYALLTLQLSAAGMLVGVFTRRVPPQTPLEAVVLRDRDTLKDK